MKRKFTLLFVLSLLLFNQVIFSQTTSDPRATVFATVNSGSWATTAVWETYSTYAAAIAATPGMGTAATGVPSGTHNVLIRTGHTVTMGAANRGCKSIIIQSGGKLWANETSARRLQLGAGGTGFTYPLTDTVQIDGVLGGASDGVYIESGVNAQNINISGSGSIDIGRIRTIGGGGASATGILNVNIDANVNVWQSGNYGLSLVYNPTTTDNYTLTIKSGKAITMKTTSTTFHNSQTSSSNLPTNSYGNYTYNVQGTLDLALTTATSTIIAPTPATSKISLNIDGGTMKTGTSFKADTILNLPIYDNSMPPQITGYYNSAGMLDFKIINGGILDASLATSFNVRKTTDGAGGTRDLVFASSTTSSIKLPVSSSEVRFPIGTTANPNTVRLTNSGTADVFTVSVKPTIDNTPSTANVVNRQWTINEAAAGGSMATVALSWVTGDQAAGFNPASTVVIQRWNGTSYESYPATVTGTGTANDPYVATTTAGAVTAFSPFIVVNSAAIPAPVNFISTKAFTKGNGVQVEWTTAQEAGILRYVIERSADGYNFVQGGVVAAANGIEASYNWFDATPLPGASYYRIRAVESGTSKVTTIMKVTIGKNGAGMVIASNPVRNGMLNLQLSGMNKGSYTLVVYNATGQQVLSKALLLEGTSLSQAIALPNLAPGVYTVQLKGAAAITKQIVIQ